MLIRGLDALRDCLVSLLDDGQDVSGGIGEPRDERATLGARDPLLVLVGAVVALEAHAALCEFVDGCLDVVDREVEDRVGRRREVGLRVDERVPTAGQVQRE